MKENTRKYIQLSITQLWSGTRGLLRIKMKFVWDRAGSIIEFSLGVFYQTFNSNCSEGAGEKSLAK